MKFRYFIREYECSTAVNTSTSKRWMQYMFTLKVLGKKNDEMRSEAEGVDEKGVSWLPELKQITRVIETMS